ncbi:MAG: SDR family oxidoreductase [Epsilonproteobacteria bacterium]|nr:SDR family oxidoreductase [Campylobacterota bacterium]
MSQQVVLITGASSGMGYATAQYLLTKGFKVYASSRDSSKLFDIKDKNFTPLCIDLTSQKSIDNAIAHIIQKENKIDILVNNAGYGLVSSVEDFTEEELQEQFNINLFGLLRVTKATIPYMRKAKSGVIINISSFLGKIGLPLLTLYNATKYAVEGVTDSLRYELREYNIRVHSILPGFFDTQFARDNLRTNESTFHKDSPYKELVSNLAPQIVHQINNGNSAEEVAKLIYTIIEDTNFPARVTVGDKAKKFLAMRKELSDEDFERRVREYYGLT